MTEREAAGLIEQAYEIVKRVIEAGHNPALDLSCAKYHLYYGLANLNNEFDED
ncbi:hypothetical protein [Paenibacillus cremeus]|uniref:hypothetical protein n=1 Tax=Paenibacillus cremeus TaxID=2163881 RepID=UPI0016484576|nr:hypothetical protein [Paenibacillus cremeus]